MFECPRCKSALSFKYQPQYHNEYIDMHFICDSCGFRTRSVDGYKDFSSQRDRLMKEYNIKFKKKDQEDQADIDNLIKNMDVLFSQAAEDLRKNPLSDEYWEREAKFLKQMNERSKEMSDGLSDSSLKGMEKDENNKLAVKTRKRKKVISDIKVGWICPRCNKAISPYKDICPYCDKED